MKPIAMYITILVLSCLVFASCADTPTGPNGVALGTFSAVIDGVPFTAVTTYAFDEDGRITIGAKRVTGSTEQSFSFTGSIIEPATYTLFPGGNVMAGYSTIADEKLTMHLANSGKIRVVTIDADEETCGGTFEFTAQNWVDPTAPPVVVTDGVFFVVLLK